MRVLCLKPFQFSIDGIHPFHAKSDDTPDVPDDLIPGLVQEGFVTLTLETKPADLKLETKSDANGTHIGAGAVVWDDPHLIVKSRFDPADLTGIIADAPPGDIDNPQPEPVADPQPEPKKPKKAAEA